MASSTTKLTDEERDFLRKEASRALAQLSDEFAALDSPSQPWIPIENNDDDQSELSFECQFLNHTGFLLVPQFSSLEECAAMKRHMADLVNGWDPDQDNLDSFGTNVQQNQKRGDYFLESADRIHFFAEPTALHDTEADSNGEGTKSSRLKPDFMGEQKIHALNKVGHALHRQDNGSPFTDYCESDKIRHLVVDSLRWRNPVVPQSMYIFKAAHHGGTVHAHQDSTFLYTTPHQSCLGLWLALDAATIDNGCLWLRPKSHREPVRRQYKRNPGHFGPEPIDARSNEAQGDTSLDKFVMEPLVEKSETEGKDVLPVEATSVRDLIQQGFIPVECQAGDLLVFCGTLEHMSLPNCSDEPRHTFQLHLVEGPPYAEWSKYNWLQYPKGKEFVPLEKTK